MVPPPACVCVCRRVHKDISADLAFGLCHKCSCLLCCVCVDACVCQSGSETGCRVRLKKSFDDVRLKADEKGRNYEKLTSLWWSFIWRDLIERLRRQVFILLARSWKWKGTIQKHWLRATKLNFQKLCSKHLNKCVCLLLSVIFALTDCDPPPHIGWYSGSAGPQRANQSYGLLFDCLLAFTRTDGSLVNEKWHWCEMLRAADADWWRQGRGHVCDSDTGRCQSAAIFFSPHRTTQTGSKWKTMSVTSAIYQK